MSIPSFFGGKIIIFAVDTDSPATKLYLDSKAQVLVMLQKLSYFVLVQQVSHSSLMDKGLGMLGLAVVIISFVAYKKQLKLFNTFGQLVCLIYSDFQCQ